MADFTPTYTQVQLKGPFHFWAQKVLPTVYDDSLSYYELLTKVVNYLNQNVDDINTLNTNVENIYNSYLQLQSYVNTYFDQNFPQLVADTLDEMAEDGTLTELISAYIDPYFEDKSDEIDDVLDEQNDTIALLNGRLDSYVSQHAGLNIETILFESESGPVFCDPDNATYIELSDAIQNYDYIKFVWKHRNNVCTQEFDVEQFAGTNDYINLTDTISTGTLWEMCTFNLTDATSDDDNKLLIAHSTVFDSSSYANGDVDDTMNTGILKVIGVATEQNDTEILDARVGVDGTVYESLGAAIRGQISELSGEISGATGVVKHVISGTEVEQELNPNEYYVFGEIEMLMISLAQPTNNDIVNEYKFRFSAGENASIALPMGIVYERTLLPTAGKTFEVSIIDNFAKYTEWDTPSEV